MADVVKRVKFVYQFGFDIHLLHDFDDAPEVIIREPLLVKPESKGVVEIYVDVAKFQLCSLQLFVCEELVLSRDIFFDGLVVANILVSLNVGLEIVHEKDGRPFVLRAIFVELPIKRIKEHICLWRIVVFLDMRYCPKGRGLPL